MFLSLQYLLIHHHFLHYLHNHPPTASASDSTAAETTLTATVLSATDCTVTVQLGSWLQNLTTAGTYRVWLLITFSGGVGPLAWPARMDDRIVVTVA